ncbi:MAG: hypothetical protein ACTSQB_02945 [Candidatus Heimdallarchaeota archaeon]
MQNRTKQILWIITIISCIILGESLAATAVPTSIDNEVTPDLFHMEPFYLNITISETEFSPAEFTVKESATVNLTIESIDVDHTFYIAEYDINETIVANTTINIAFEADRLGSFTYSSLNCSETGTMIVEDPYVPDLPRPKDVRILFDFKHNNNVTLMAEKYATIINWTRDSNFVYAINNYNELVSLQLMHYDILIILEPQINLTVSELDDIQFFIERGGSLILGGSNETAFTNSYKLTEQFGFTYTNTSARFINSTDLIDPIGENNTLSSFTVTDFLDHPLISENQYVPLTDELVTQLEYTGTVMDFNATMAQELNVNNNLTDTENLIDCYVMANGNETIFADVNGNFIVDVNETIGVNNTFVVAFETAFNARVISVGDANIFNNTMVGRYLGNEIFYQRTLQWVAKMYAILQSSEYTLSAFDVNIGTDLNTSIVVKAQNNTIVDSIEVEMRIWRSARIEFTFTFNAINDSHFERQFNTTNIRRGTVYINAVAHKRGYGYNVTNDYYLEVFQTEPGPMSLAIPYLITYISSLIVGIAALALFFIRVIKVPKTKATSEADDDTEAGEDETETEDEIDLDEYETEEEPDTAEDE